MSEPIRTRQISPAFEATLRTPSRYERYGKPALDRIAGFILTIVTSPVLLVLALIARVSFGGPAILRLPHIGKNEQSFTLYKLRTSRDIDEPETGGRVGQFLRDWSLDELPQIWNVVGGSMSLVGPRPVPPATADKLDNWERQRHQVTPGITGPWQVEARGDQRDLSDNMHYDVQYIDQLSFSADLRFLARTVAALASRRESNHKIEAGEARLRVRFPHIRLILWDQLVWVLALAIAAAGRLDFSWTAVDKVNLAGAVVLAVTAQLVWGFSVGLYRGRWRLASYEEIAWVAAGTALITAVFFATTLFNTRFILPRGAMLAAGAFHLLGALGGRYVARALYTAQGKSIHQRPHKMLVFGAGDAGLRAAEAIWSDDEADALPVAFLDDDELAWKRNPLGLPVVGGRAAIPDAARRYNADVLLIAIPSAPGAAVEGIATAAQRAGLEVRILPRLAKFIHSDDGQVLASDIRQLTLADFLNRDEIRLDLEEIAGYITGKRVLVTGAGGSIGAELCRIIDRFDPKQVFKLDRDENALHALQLEQDGRALLESEDLILCDIRDDDAVKRVFRDAKPHVVFHAAAHKHVTFLERHPEEAIKTNVQGTLNLLAAAHEVGVERFVNISTDKAADPTSVLGHTKRLAERLTSHFDEVSAASCLSVRFGNVLGSRGSVIPTFRRQIEQGEAITVTDPEVTRFFMTIEEACELVVQAGAIGGYGDVYVLDMGEPVKIVDLAQRLHAQLKPGRPADIEFTGLRPGEKLHEVLAGREEQLIDQPHELLSRYAVPPLNPDDISRALNKLV